MTIETKINLEDYRKLIFTLTYRKPWTIFVTLLGLLTLTRACLSYFGVIIQNENMVLQFIFGILLTFLTPFKVYSTAKRNFTSNQRLQEAIEYELSKEKLKIKGESFNSELEWSKTNRIEELNNWFLIYQSKITANIIPKQNLSETEIEEMRKIFLEQKNLKLKLKKTAGNSRL